MNVRSVTVTTYFDYQHLPKNSVLWLGTAGNGVFTPGSTFHYDLDELKLECEFPSGQAAAAWVAGQYQNPRGASSLASLSGSQTFTGAHTFNGVVTANNVANTFDGTFSGNGAGLTNVSLRSVNTEGALAWTTNSGNNTPTFVSHLIGDGAGLVNVPAKAITGGLTTDVAVVMPDGSHTLYFTNGILMKIQ